MEIVLKKYVDDLGEAGSIVNVNPGYARNYLFPNKMALPATAANMRVVEVEAASENLKAAKARGQLEKVADKLAAVSVTAKVKVGEEDKVFGSVTAANIAELLGEQGHEYEHRNIILEEPIKALGQYTVTIKLGYGVNATIEVWVIRE